MEAEAECRQRDLATIMGPPRGQSWDPPEIHGSEAQHWYPGPKAPELALLGGAAHVVSGRWRLWRSERCSSCACAGMATRPWPG
jgi:hypothetical protein